MRAQGRLKFPTARVAGVLTHPAVGGRSSFARPSSAARPGRLTGMLLLKHPPVSHDFHHGRRIRIRAFYSRPATADDYAVSKRTRL
jgi:hypothetical protein